jgi:UDP-glucose 4-epimerase
MKVLLTGGVGYIGSHTALSLAQIATHIVLYDNLSNSEISTVKRIREIIQNARDSAVISETSTQDLVKASLITSSLVIAPLVEQPPTTTQVKDPSITFIQGDICDTSLLTQVLQDHQLDSVIHFAGLKAVGESVAQPISYYANNVQGTISLLQAMQACNVKKIVFSSSATVYGEPQQLPLTETHPTSATNPYGRSKLHIEEMLHDLCLSDPDWSVVCLRYFNPVGAHSSGLIGERPSGAPSNLMPYITQVATGQRSHLNVFGNDYPTPDGTGVRDYIHVVDLAEGHVAALDYVDKHVGWQAINLGTGKGFSVLELVKAFESVNKVTVPLQFVNRRAGDIATCYADTNTALSTLKWFATRSLADMCQSAWHFEKNSTKQ